MQVTMSHAAVSDGPSSRVMAKRTPRQIAEAGAAGGDLIGLHVHAARRGEAVVDHRDEGPVAAAVVEQAPPGAAGREPARQVEPAPVAPGDEAVRTVDLLAGVVAVGDARVGAGVIRG